MSTTEVYKASPKFIEEVYKALQAGPTDGMTVKMVSEAMGREYEQEDRYVTLAFTALRAQGRIIKIRTGEYNRAYYVVADVGGAIKLIDNSGEAHFYKAYAKAFGASTGPNMGQQLWAVMTARAIKSAAKHQNENKAFAMFTYEAIKDNLEKLKQKFITGLKFIDQLERQVRLWEADDGTLWKDMGYEEEDLIGLLTYGVDKVPTIFDKI